MDLGELKARLTADNQGLRAEILALKKDLTDLGDAGKKAGSDINPLNDVLLKIGLNTDELKKIESHLRNADTSKLEKGLAEIVVAIQKLAAQSAGIDRVTADLTGAGAAADRAADEIGEVSSSLDDVGRNVDQVEEIEEQLNDTADAADSAAMSLDGVQSILIAIGAVVSLDKIADIIKATVGESTKLTNSLKGLNSIATAFNQNIDNTNDVVQELSDDGLAPLSSYASGLKSLLSTGLGLDQANELLETFKDRAAFGKSETISFSQAVENLAQSFKTESSEIGDLSGMTENYSYILEVGARALGKKVTALTAAERAQAKYLGIMQVSTPFVGDAAKLADSFSGEQAKLNAKWVEAKQIMGDAYIPVLEEAMNVITPLLLQFKDWAAVNDDVIAGTTASTLVVGALIAGIAIGIPVIQKLILVYKALRTAIIAANAAATTGAALTALAGPIGILIAGIGLVAAGVWAYKTAADATTDSIWKFAESQEELNKKLDESPLSRSVEDVKNLQEDIDMVNKLLIERIKLEEDLLKIENEKLAARASNDNSLFFRLNKDASDLQKSIKEIDSQLSVLGINTPDDAPKKIEELNKQLNASIPALKTLERENMRGVATQVQHIDKVTALKKQYEQLDKQVKLSAAQKTQLNEVVKQLTQEYPSLSSELDEEGRWHIKNTDLLEDLMQAERDSVTTSAEASKKRYNNWKTETESKLKLAKAQVAALMAAEGVNIEDTGIGSRLPGELGKGLDLIGDMVLRGTAMKAQENVNKYQMLINDIEKDIASITAGKWDDFTPKLSDYGGEEKEKKKKKEKTLAELQQEQYQASLKFIEYKKSLNQMNEAQELASLQKLEEKYKKNAEIRMDLEVKIYQLRDQMRKTTFDASQEWIEQEERRMTLGGKTEEEITKMKIDAWTRVRSRYQKDSDLYKQADTQVYNAKVIQIKAVAKAEEEAAKEREKLSKENTKKAIDAIDKAKKAELDALEDRKKAINKFYEDQEKIIDNSERAKERNELTAEMEKYRFATSEKGQKTFLELQEKLRQMDIEEQKRNLQDERDQKLESLDKQKDDVESWYDDLKAATEDLTGDLTNLYKLADDERLKSFITTNDKIKEEMLKLQAALAMGASSGGGSSSVISQMMANSGMWSSASADERRRLDAENERLGASIGATKNAAEGKWYKAEGTPLYHTGGIAGEMNFRSGDMLMPDEIKAILRTGETNLTPQQVGSLINSAAGGNVVHIDKFMEVNDPVFEDGIDLRTFGRETGGEAAEMLRKQMVGGG